MPPPPVTTEAPRVSIISLGCAKNEVDSEEILTLLQQDGCQADCRDAASDIMAGTDVVVINTCGFIESAREESIQTILEVAQRKSRGEVGKIIVAGCLSQRYGHELADSLPEVDGFIGAGQMHAVPGLVRQSLIRPEQIFQVGERPHHRWVNLSTRARTGAPWSAYLKISEGCDHACSFCAIPSFRGRHQSKPIEDVIREAQSLAAAGVVELNLIAQDSTQYGHDLYGRFLLPDLLRELNAIEGIRWIRLFYCYPSRLSREVIESLGSLSSVCHYIDMPLQHAADTMLRRMKRPMSGSRYLKLIESIRAAMPDVAIRSTFIVGFPGESQQEFRDLEDFVEAAQLDHVGVFAYSAEEGTPAAQMRPQVGARLRAERRAILLERQQRISLARNRMWIGREVDVLVEQRSSLDPAALIGRTFRNAPEVDGAVVVRRCGAAPGAIVRARVEDARPYELIAVACDRELSSAAERIE